LFYLRHQVTPYVILFIERDGSTYLTSMLQTHPEIKADYERFAVLKQKGANGAQQLEWAYQLFSPPLIGRIGAIGFKTKLVDILDEDGFTKLLYEKNCHIIQMTRRNLVKAVVSRINARRLFENLKAALVVVAAGVLALFSFLGPFEPSNQKIALVAAPLVAFYFGSRR